MSRSIHQAHVIVWAASDKPAKQMANRRLRRKVAEALHVDVRTEVVPEMKEVFSERDMPKAPKSYCPGPLAMHWLRK